MDPDLNLNAVKINEDEFQFKTILDLPKDVLRIIPTFLSHSDRIKFALVCQQFCTAESEAGLRKFDLITVAMRPNLVILLDVEGKRFLRNIEEDGEVKNTVQYLRNALVDNLLIDDHFSNAHTKIISRVFKTIMFKKLEYYTIEADEYDEPMINGILKDKKLNGSKIHFKICQQKGKSTVTRPFLAALPKLQEFQLKWMCDNGKEQTIHRDTVIDDTILISIINSVQFLTLRVICTNVTAAGLKQVHEILSSSEKKRKFTIDLDESVYAEFHNVLFGKFESSMLTGFVSKTKKLRIEYTPHNSYFEKERCVSLAIQTRET